MVFEILRLGQARGEHSLVVVDKRKARIRSARISYNHVDDVFIVFIWGGLGRLDRSSDHGGVVVDLDRPVVTSRSI